LLDLILPGTILILDHNVESGALLARSLHRKFPAAEIQLCKEPGEALECLATGNFDAVILHRTEEHDIISLTRTFRSAEPRAVIVALSRIDRRDQVMSAGATVLMEYDQWLLIGDEVVSALSQS
jgi:hypothetical protein